MALTTDYGPLTTDSRGTVITTRPITPRQVYARSPDSSRAIAGI